MNGEDAIDPDEFVLRRIHKNNVNLAADNIVKRCEFEPKPRDTDGISLFRERYTSVAALVGAARSPNDFYVARFRVSELTALGFQLDVTPGGLPGHVSIHELTYAAFQANRSGSKDLQQTLAELASQRIYHRPPACQDE